MAHVLKYSSKNSKGIIVFTHKEKQFFENLSVDASRLMNLLKEKYYLAMHWGYYHVHVKTIKYIDIHFGGEGTVTFEKPTEIHHIKLSTRNFCNEIFKKINQFKSYDILNISRPIKAKRLDHFFELIRKLYDKGYLYKVLLICPLPQDFSVSENKSYYSTIYSDYINIFNEKERKYFDLIMLSEDGYPFQATQTFISTCMNSSKIFMLLSDVEGESRVISEAILSGMIVIVKEYLKGGGLDYLDEYNSKLFNRLDEGVIKIVDVIENFDKYECNTDKYELELSEKYSKIKLYEELKSFYNVKNEFLNQDDLNFDNLSKGLCSHILTLPLDMRNQHTNDINSVNSFVQYLKLMNNL